MNKIKNYLFKMWLVPLFLVIIMSGCEDRDSITYPALITTPTVSSTNPANMTVNVPFNQQITATFSENMNSSTITTASFTLMQGTTFISGTVSYSGVTAVFIPSSNLAPNTVYTATITTGAKDDEGTALANNYVWSFTTGEAAIVVAPTVTSTDPVNAATGIALNQKIAATFSVPMDGSTFTSATFVLRQGGTSVSGFVSYTGTTAIFNPAALLSPTTAYTATITTGAKDLAGNALANNYEWSFITGTTTVVVPPTVSFTDPASSATGVALNQKVSATFSKTMDASTMTASVFTLKQGTTAVSGFVSYSGTTAIFAPSSNLTPNTVYTATITTGAKDLAGNALANNYEWNFTTGAAAVITPPTVISTDPVNVATGVALNQKVSATFSKTMDATTIQSSTFRLMQGTTEVNGFVSYSGVTAIFSPSSNLTPNTVYTATITTGAADLAGNPLANNYVWSFTTGVAVVITSPIVISTDPVNAATGVALTKKVTATFNKTMNASSITTATYTLKQGATSISGFTSYSGMSATFSPANNLTPNTLYTATITTGAEDLAGNPLLNDYVWSFTTGAAAVVIPPEVILTDPLNMATGVALNKQVSALFSVEMDASTITASTFTLMQGTTVISGFISYSDSLATFSPTSNLSPNTEYTATITTGAKDLAGISLTSNYVWRFTTAISIYSVTLSSNPQLGGTTNGSGTFNSGSSVSVSATANAGYTFTNWTENSAPVSTNANYTFIISGNRTLVANFSEIPPVQFTVTLSSNPAEGGTTNGGGSFNSGSSVTVSATANDGYAFTNWTENASEVSTDADYTFTISGNRTLAANFEELPSGPDGVDLGSAGDFAILAGSKVDGTAGVALTHIYGDVGSFPTATIDGLTPANVTGTLYTAADPIVGLAKDHLTEAYNDAQSRSLDAISLPGQLGGLTLAPGLYVNSTSSGISGTGANAILTLDAGGNSNAVWIFKMGSTLITDPGTSVVLAGGAKWENIYWSVGTSATLGTTCIFYGNILADQSITLETGATLRGRALTRIAAVTLDSNIVDKRP